MRQRSVFPFLRSAFAAAVVLNAAVAIAAPIEAATAAVTCDRWAAGTGNDAASGLTRDTPVATLKTLTARLTPGQTGCVIAGSTLSSYYDGGGGWGIVSNSGTPGSPITVRSEPGGRATIAGLVAVLPTAHDIVFDSLDFAQGNARRGNTLIQVNGDRVALRNSTVTHPLGICIGVGFLDGNDPGGPAHSADDMVIEHNRIHHCGTDPSANWTTTDSGAHGVYILNTSRAIIRQNVIHDGQYRGIQVYPRGDGVLIERNLLLHNATHVNIGRATDEGGNLPTPDPDWYPRNVTIRRNLMMDRWTTNGPPGDTKWAEKNEASIYGFFPAGSPTFGNTASDNCVDFASMPVSAGNGIAFSSNFESTPTLTEPSPGVYKLGANDVCAGYGPDSIQAGTTPPPPPPAPALTLTARLIGTHRTGTIDVVEVRAVNSSDEWVPMVVQWTATAAGPLATTIIPISVSRDASACTNALRSGRCVFGDVPPGATAVVTARLALARPGALAINATASSTSDAVRPGTAASAASVIGRTCTIIGTMGNDRLTGTTGINTMCGFDGNDTFIPLAGDDHVYGGIGGDHVSYSTASTSLVVNLTQQAAWNTVGTSIGYDVYTSIEHATGGLAADQILGNAAANRLDGGAGNDKVYGYDGNDVVIGGTGNDLLWGHAGNDAMYGSLGYDTCSQGLGTGTRSSCER